MSTFAEKLAAKKAAPRPFADVTVLMADELVEERNRLQEIIDTPDNDQRLTTESPAELAQKALDELEANAGDSLIAFRFTQLPGSEWTTLTSQHPPRPFVPIDDDCGYNFDAVAFHAARFVDNAGRHYGARIEDGAEVPLSDEEWADLFDALTGHEAAAIRNTVWGLNEYMPKLQLAAMGKAFGATARSEKD